MKVQLLLSMTLLFVTPAIAWERSDRVRPSDFQGELGLMANDVAVVSPLQQQSSDFIAKELSGTRAKSQSVPTGGKFASTTQLAMTSPAGASATNRLTPVSLTQLPGPDDGSARREELPPTSARQEASSTLRTSCRYKYIYTGCHGTFHLFLSSGGTAHFWLFQCEWLDWLEKCSQPTELANVCGCDAGDLKSSWPFYNYFTTHCHAAGIVAWAFCRYPDCSLCDVCCTSCCCGCWCSCLTSCVPRYSVWYCKLDTNGNGHWRRFDCDSVSHAQ